MTFIRISNANVAHLTSVHPRYDTHIFHKMCSSFGAAGHAATLVVAGGTHCESSNGVCIVDVGSFKGPLDRVVNAPGRVLTKALVLADLYLQLYEDRLNV
jgi:hypothetical protein